MAISAAVAAFRNPGEFPGAAVSNRRAYLNLLWSYYKNSAFDDVTAWNAYKEKFTLYRNIRSIYNPTRRLVNFYVAQVYPGVLSEDANTLPDGVQLAIPLSDDTDDKLKAAIAQFWQWSNWQSGNKLMVRYGGATGSSLVEVVDRFDRGKVSTAVVWPGWIADQRKDGGPALVIDDVGNVKSYALEYDAVDENGETYKYRKEVDESSFKFFKNDQPFDYGQGVEFENAYGFVPAVWCKHLDEGDDYGCPAISGAISKIDELNGIVSHTHDQIDLLIDSPGIIATSGNVGEIGAQASRTQQDEYNATAGLRSKPTRRLLLKGPADTTWIPLTGNLEPDKVIPHIEKLLGEIEHDFPELSMYTELRKMSQVTGPGAARMMGDVYSRVLEVSANYDQQSIKLFQMAVAIGGFRFAEGKEGWREKNAQRQKFAPFNLESYARGELDIAILPRPLIPTTEADAIELTGMRLDNAKKAQGVFNDDKILELAGIEDQAERAQMIAQRKAENPQPNPAANAPQGVRSLFLPRT